MVGGSELEVVGSRDEDEDEVDVVSGDDVCDEDVRLGAREEEVVGLEEKVGGLDVADDESEEDTTCVVEEEKNTDEDALSLRVGLLDVVEVLTLSLEEVDAAVLLA